AAAGFRSVPALNRILVARTKARAAAPHGRQMVDDLRAADAATRSFADSQALPVDLRVQRVHLDRVTVSYPGAAAPALSSIDVAIERGARVGIVGASGAGKSTLVAVLLGLLDTDEGEVRIDGKPLVRCRASFQ